jgi:GMP synthase-like glutamine amidotransferase
MTTEPQQSDASRRPVALVLSHEEATAPAVVGRLLVERGWELRRHVVLPDGGGEPDLAFPPLDGVDLVVAFGSFSNAYDPAAQGWVRPEVELISSLVADDVPFLGVCFGGQLLAQALGGTVERAPVVEIGAVEVEVADAVRGRLPAGPWFTWHEDRVLLPEGVEVLARTEHAVQVFRSGRAIGLQFHPEADHDLIAEWLRLGPDHVPDGLTPDGVLAQWRVAEEDAHRNCARLVDWVLDELGPRARTD